MKNRRSLLFLLALSAVVLVLLVFHAFAQDKEPTLTEAQKLEIREAQMRLMNVAPAYKQAEQALNALVAQYTPEGYEMQDTPAGLKLVKKPEPKAKSKEPTKKK